MAEIAEVVVVGAGTMGSQIALQTAYGGRHRVTLADSNSRQLEHARAQNEALTRRGVEKGRLTGDEAAAALERIRPATDLAQALATADLASLPITASRILTISTGSCGE